MKHDKIKIISGGQTGVDRAALDVALELGIPCGGWCPKGRRSEDGQIPAKYPLLETTYTDYRVRTEKNVTDSDGTLILTDGPPTGGTAFTIRLAKRHKRPYYIVDLAHPNDVNPVLAWLLQKRIQTLNVAGPRESKVPGIHDLAVDFLKKVLNETSDNKQGGLNMKVLGIMGSPRIGGNSDILLDQALAGAQSAGAEVEKIILNQKKISGCQDCKKCNETGLCVLKDDMPEIHKKILEADVIIHSVPVYFWSMTAQMKAYLDRWCALFDANWRWHKHYYQRMKGKGIGLITVCGDADPHTADPIVNCFKPTVDFGKLRWLGTVMASASEKGEIAKNETAKQEAYELGRKAATP